MRQREVWSEVYADDRCVHCGDEIADDEMTREHVPSKTLLQRPFPLPDPLPTVAAHLDCNREFSLDEQYVSCLLASVISGSTDVDANRFRSQARALANDDRLRQRIERCRTVQLGLFGDTVIFWRPELDRVRNVIVKNAKGHIWFDTDLMMEGHPEHIGIMPFPSISPERRQSFEDGTETDMWAEIGTRLFQQQAYLEVGPGGWKSVQDGVYRYAVDDSGVVRIVMHEYLAAEVFWTS